MGVDVKCLRLLQKKKWIRGRLRQRRQEKRRKDVGKRGNLSEGHRLL